MSTVKTYPVTHTVVYAGRRLAKDNSLLHVYAIMDGDRETNAFMFSKRAGMANSIGAKLELIEIEEGKFKISSAKYLGRYENNDFIARWKAMDEGAETEKDLIKEMKEKDEWADVLRPIRIAYLNAQTRRQQAAIIARVIRAIQG